MGSKKVGDSKTIMTYLMSQNDVNLSGIVHGGVILKLIDTIAFVCATKHSGKVCVTASFDRVDFLKPIFIGELVTLYGSINYVGKTSMEIGISIEAENIQTCKKRHTNTCFVTMVAIDKNKKPTMVPRLKPETTEEKRRYKVAELRRKERLKIIRR